MFRLRAMVGAAVLALAAGTASAATIDFTDSATYAGADSSSISGSVFGKTWTVTGRPADSLNFSQAYDGAPFDSPLADEIDGLGIVDDEISNSTDMRAERLRIEFSGPVTIAGLHFLDLFFGPDGAEKVQVWINRDGFSGFGGGGADAVVEATDAFQTMGGYRFYETNWTGVTSLVFGVGAGSNDPAGVPDAALAGIEVVPLPAAGWLLLGGLGGLAAMKRRKKA